MKKKTGLLICVSALVLSLGVTLGIEAAKSNAEQAEAIETVGKVVLAVTPSGFTNIYRFSVPNNCGEDVGGIYLHAWGSDGGDTTWGNFIKLTNFSYNEMNERVYTYATNYTYTGFQIIQYDNNPTYHRSYDIEVGSNTAWSWSPSIYEYTQTSASAWTPSNQTYYFYDYRALFDGTAKCYAKQSNGSLDTGTKWATPMTAVPYGSGHLYSIILDPAFDEFNVGLDDDTCTGDLWIRDHRGACYCYWATDAGWSTDLDWVKAHDWANNTMHIRDIPTSNVSDTGTCRGANGYYKKAKTAYTNFTPEIIAKFSNVTEYADAQTRFVEWARVNGETASFSGTTLTVNSIKYGGLTTITASADENTTVVVIVTFVSVGAVASYFFLAKKKKS